MDGMKVALRAAAVSATVIIGTTAAEAALTTPLSRFSEVYAAKVDPEYVCDWNFCGTHDVFYASGPFSSTSLTDPFDRFAEAEGSSGGIFSAEQHSSISDTLITSNAGGYGGGNRNGVASSVFDLSFQLNQAASFQFAQATPFSGGAILEDGFGILIAQLEFDDVIEGILQPGTYRLLQTVCAGSWADAGCQTTVLFDGVYAEMRFELTAAPVMAMASSGWSLSRVSKSPWRTTPCGRGSTSRCTP